MLDRVLKYKFILILLIFIVFITKGYIFLDPDFGWHLRMGELISQKGIPKTDPFSYTMPSYPFVDHEWLTNFLISKIYPLAGMLGLSVLHGLIFLLTLVVCILKPIKENFDKKRKEAYTIKLILSFLVLAIFFPFFGVRPQVESWLFLAIIVRLILNERIWNKWRFAVPLLLILWVNLHGSFALAIFILFTTLLFRTLRTKKINFYDILIFGFSFLATFINPYGWRVWWEVWMQITDSSLHLKIMEWRPFFFKIHLSFLIFFTLSLVFFSRYWKKFLLEEKVLFLLLLFQAITTLRHVPLWTIVSLPFLFRSIDYFYDDVKKINSGLKRFSQVNKVFFWGATSFVLLDFALSISSRPALTPGSFYPTNDSLEYLKKSDFSGQLFSPYDWGGYLIWKLPEKKVFIDGRMPSWRWKAGIPGESDYAMEDYMAILGGRVDLIEMFSKYNITTVFWPKEIEEEVLGPLARKLRGYLYRLIDKESESFDFLAELESLGWQKVFEDKVAVIYRRPVF